VKKQTPGSQILNHTDCTLAMMEIFLNISACQILLQGDLASIYPEYFNIACTHPGRHPDASFRLATDARPFPGKILQQDCWQDHGGLLLLVLGNGLAQNNNT